MNAKGRQRKWRVPQPLRRLRRTARGALLRPGRGVRARSSSTPPRSRPTRPASAVAHRT
ncbi:hypothetical protein LV779_03160 [Streptomyces thinghirensis]|nr:hypothetical protein [Streptomyces thinghirensis]